MHHLALTPDDNEAVLAVVAASAAAYERIEDPELIRRAPVLARALPEHILEFLERFRVGEPSALCLISGLDIDQQRLGPTPRHWHDVGEQRSPVFAQEIFFLLCASVLGDVFGWSTQQAGRIMHDVLPIKGHENYEIGSNSVQHLSWHTEDSFHPCRGDYVALMCLKNPDEVATTVCDAADLDWSALDVDALFEPEFTQMPDNSHLPSMDGPSGDATVDRLRTRSFDLIRSWNDRPVKRPILSGARDDPYMALDPYHMKLDGWPERSLQAFEALCAQIEGNLRNVRLRPGDTVFIDNFRAVHGRRSFRPRYDGSDRWLKRLNVTRNLRGSRGWRRAPDDRVIY
ncbi:arginine beta-hydroxylase, Fe(II)/alpha-ketoglutarate-dependent [Nocardia sp. alder85J]|uniref:arginine beta-hydroxylase, Fe(II)/alpha-ketoglutarate-dependent n=1 Tax=Nocardia sp. alder85J TaxID=2862949 RepID=UPI001CD4E37D|nr:arginine beta-hydroxylase, Fe(II)/alpha-ketoglutarate-dependent [Nocardia sp. alder85J]MCX4091628.1 arginine beta-hydroxylase, Fe(II)/alpha-ketoglutarate-dependent [Nocardia sp. alder85J]